MSSAWLIDLCLESFAEHAKPANFFQVFALNHEFECAKSMLWIRDNFLSASTLGRIQPFA
jgi:hypothetical protein